MCKNKFKNKIIRVTKQQLRPIHKIQETIQILVKNELYMIFFYIQKIFKIKLTSFT